MSVDVRVLRAVQLSFEEWGMKAAEMSLGSIWGEKLKFHLKQKYVHYKQLKCQLAML